MSNKMTKNPLKILIKKLKMKNKMKGVMKVKRKKKKKFLEMMSVRLRSYFRMTLIGYTRESRSRFGTYMRGSLPI